MVRLKNIDLMVILTIIAANIVCIFLSIHVTAIGIALALPLVFLFPGYVVTEVLSFKRPLNTTYRTILSIGLSLAIDILSGFLLNLLPIGLRAVSWIVLLGLLTVIFSLLLAFLRRGVPVNERYIPAIHFRFHEYALVGLAVLIVVLSLQYAAQGVVQQPHQGFTQLWLLPPQTEKSCALRLGVRSFESTSTTYMVMTKENGKQVSVQSSIVLAPQQEWDSAVAVPATATTNVSVDVSLYRADRPGEVYRDVHMVVHTVKGKNVVCAS